MSKSSIKRPPNQVSVHWPHDFATSNSMVAISFIQGRAFSPTQMRSWCLRTSFTTWIPPSTTPRPPCRTTSRATGQSGDGRWKLWVTMGWNQDPTVFGLVILPRKRQHKNLVEPRILRWEALLQDRVLVWQRVPWYRHRLISLCSVFCLRFLSW